MRKPPALAASARYATAATAVGGGGPSTDSPRPTLRPCISAAPPSIAHASIVSIGSAVSSRWVTTLPKAKDSAAQNTSASNREAARLSGSGCDSRTTPHSPSASPTSPGSVSRSSGRKARAKPVVSTGDSDTVTAATALVVPRSPTNSSAW